MVGAEIELTLTISFKAGITDMKVELFTPDHTNTIMILCDVQVVSTGSLTISGSTTPVYDSRDGTGKYYDRAIIDLANVENTACTTLSQCQIVITYKSIMIDNPSASDGTYWVSAGIEYSNSELIWVGQCSYDTVQNNVVATQPEVNWTGPAEVAIGSSSIFSLSLYLPNPSADVTLGAFTPLNTSSVMSVCSAKIKSMGSNFNCGYDHSAITKTMYPATTGLGMAMAEVNGGKFLNSGSRHTRDAYEDNVIEFEVIYHTYIDEGLVDQLSDVGATLDISGNQIWAATTPVKYIPEIIDSGMASVNMNIDPGTDSFVETLTPKVVRLAMEIPYNTTASYELVVETPIISDAPVFQLCSVTLVSGGNNLPCLTLDKTTVYSARTTSGSAADKGVMLIGGLTNLPVEASSLAANSIDVDIIFTALEHPSATQSSQHDLTVTANYAGKTTSLTHTFTVSGTNAGTPNVTSPDFNMTVGIGTDTVREGLATSVVLNIDTGRNYTYTKMDVEFIMPSGNSSSKFKVCRSRVLSTGLNLPCVTPSWLNNKVAYTSKFNDGINNRAVHNIGGVCNIGRSSDIAEDKMSLAVDLMVLSHDEMAAKEWTSAGVMYSNKQIWVGQFALNIDTTSAVAPATIPHIGVIKNTTLAMAPIGYPMVYGIIFKVAPGDSVDLLVEVESNTAGLYVCGLRIMAAGENFPCLDPTTEPVFETWPSNDNKKATFNASYITNVGNDALVNNDFYDGNSIMFEVITQLGPDVADGTQLGFTTTVTYATGQSKAITQSMTATSNTSIIDRNVTQSANFSFTMASVDQNDTADITYGEAKRFILDMTLPKLPVLPAEYTVKFLSSPLVVPGYMEVCDAAVIEVGKNFPCLRKTEIHPVFEKRPGSNYNGIATLNLGFICNSAMGTDEASNRIRVEGIFKLLHNTSSTSGDTHTVHVAVNSNDFEIFVANVELTQTSTLVPKYNNTIATNQTTLYVNLTNSDIIDMEIGVNTTLPLVLNVHPGSVSKVKFDVDTFTNDSVVALVKDIRLMGTGTNIACLYVDEALGQTFTPVLNSSLGTCQVDQGYLDLGTVSNLGLSYRKETNTDDDDSVLLHVDLMLPDFELAEHNAVFPISFGAMVANVIVLCEQKIRVKRNDNEVPILQFTADVNGTLTTESQIYINILLSHTNMSSGRAINASMMMFLPPYLSFSNLTQANITPVEIINDPGFINFGDLLMCNAVEFTVLLESNNSVEVPIDIIPDNTIIFLEAGSSTYHRSGSNILPDAFLTTETQYLNFSAKVTQDDTCNDVLGMETGVIRDCQLASSIESDPQHPAFHGRLRGNSEWGPFVRGGRLPPYRYFQVAFGNVTLVAKIIMQRGNITRFPHKVTAISLEYSNDGSAYERAETIDVAFGDNEDEIVVEMGRPTPARYMRIYISKDNSGTALARIGLKFEFIGCFKSSDISAQDICDIVTKHQPTIPEFHARSMTYNRKTSNVHFCDAAPASDGLFTDEMVISCARSNDGLSWEKLPDDIGCLLGYDKTNDRLYAWHKNKRTMLMSTDDGAGFHTVSLNIFFTSRDDSEFESSKPIGWQSNDYLNSAEPHANYTLGNWGATSEGLFIRNGGSWSKRVTWTIP
ncbi:LOW QUALITY PROTEIN: uncharacterized protein LOC117331078 [Pecten maximus]|uniref:LOW QUALITY PROTEIN: uncharacterized protein LOC117331078 n=1 Tax=Pecten maximus TaxID=6579 RepID=UPI0014590986|nr:LOW QUALITY PROTEIN: uncharacterized protein LOC117331078 [Pecten maximus]